VGIPADEMPRIFERFHRVPETRGRTHEGTGIGLALVQELAKLHGGTVTAESTLDRGSRFFVSIPLGTEHLDAQRVGTPTGLAPTTTGADAFVQEALRWLPTDGSQVADCGLPIEEMDASAVTSSPSLESAIPNLQSPKARVLWADDNADMREYVARLLGGRFDVQAVGDGRAALEAARADPPDLVLADVMMPRLDGVGLLRALRADPRLREVPVILVSARAGEEAKVEGMAEGADDYLVKPFAARELIARVDAHVRLARERRAATDALRDREAWLGGQRKALEAALNGAPLEAALGVLVRTATDGLGDGTRAAFYLTNGDDTSLHHVVGMTAAYAAAVDGFKIGPESLACGLAMYTGNPVLTADVTADARWGPWRRLAERFDYRGCWSFPIHTSLGKPIGTFAVYWRRPREATDRDLEFATLLTQTASIIISRHTEAEVRQRAEAALQEADRRKDEFLAMLGHELRNPLVPLQSGVATLRQRKLDGDALERTSAMMERQVKHLTRLVDDLLDVSRITRGLVELRRVPVNLAEVADQAAEMVASLVADRGHDLSLAVPPKPLWVDGDPTRLTQAVFNLLNNAIKYTDPGGRIWLTVERDGGQAVVRVRDNGSGMKADLVPRVFDLFTQGDRTLDRSEGGLGLGLTLVKRLVEMHNGTVQARSDGPGRGSEFVLRLPALADEVESRPCLPPGPTTAVRVDRVLVVDDNPDVAEALTWELEGLAREFKIVQSGAAAVEAASQWRPDLILCDLGMPIMNGYETCRRLRQLPGLGGVVIAAVSGYGGDDDRIKSEAAGFDRHLVKPVGRKTLEELVKSAAGA
jgi:signal transduction histidine kinase/DNA-binding response OmpR family regulator